MVAAVTSSTAAASGSTIGATSAKDQSERFLKLLVAQLNNQDPMNPLDNAQMTSQIAQINTVSGIQQLNDSIQAMSAQYTSMQVMQGASMIGHQIVAEGNAMSVNAGVGTAALNLESDASSVKVQVLSQGGQIIDQIDLGALPGGRHNFEWDASRYTASANPTFSIVARQGNASVSATPLIRDTIASVGTDANKTMSLTLKSGSSISYNAIQSIL